MKKIIFVIIFFYNFTAQAMNQNKKTPSIPIKQETQHKVTSSYYNQLLAMLSGQSWDSSLNYPSSYNDDSLGNASQFTETDVDMSGSIAFETPPTSPRKQEQPHEEIHETHQKKNLLYWLCCCSLKDNHNKQTIHYEEIK